MGFLQLAQNLAFLRSKPFNILFKAIYYRLRLALGCKNYNYMNEWSGMFIAQPRYLNDPSDINILRLVRSFLWSNDLNALFSVQGADQTLYSQFEYDFLVKKFFRTKNTAFEGINMNLAWSKSFWNKALNNLSAEKRLEKYRYSDILFADFAINTQGIYKAKRVPSASKNPERHQEIGELFSEHLQKNRDLLGPQYQNSDNVFQKMVEDGNLYIVEYPELMQMEKERPIHERFKNTISFQGNHYPGCIEIPRAIFAEVDGYLPDRKKDFVCLGSVFNERTEIYHPFDRGCMKTRSKWELAKHHFGNAFQSDFIIRVHLGYLHFGSAIYTTAFYNLAK